MLQLKNIILAVVATNVKSLNALTSKEANVLYFEGLLLILLRISLLLFFVISPGVAPVQPAPPIIIKFVLSLLLVLPIYAIVDRCTILSIRKRDEAPWRGWIFFLIPLKIIAGLWFAVSHLTLIHGKIDANIKTFQTIPIFLYFLFVILEILPIILEFYFGMSNRNLFSKATLGRKMPKKQELRTLKRKERISEIKEVIKSLVGENDLMQAIDVAIDFTKEINSKHHGNFLVQKSKLKEIVANENSRISAEEAIRQKTGVATAIISIIDDLA